MVAPGNWPNSACPSGDNTEIRPCAGRASAGQTNCSQCCRPLWGSFNSNQWPGVAPSDAVAAASVDEHRCSRHSAATRNGHTDRSANQRAAEVPALAGNAKNFFINSASTLRLYQSPKAGLNPAQCLKPRLSKHKFNNDQSGKSGKIRQRRPRSAEPA